MIRRKLTCQALLRNDLTGQAGTHGHTQTFSFGLQGLQSRRVIAVCSVYNRGSKPGNLCSNLLHKWKFRID